MPSSEGPVMMSAGPSSHPGGDPMGDLRGTRAWRRLAAQVIAEEPICRIQGPRCTWWSTTADHIIELDQRPDLAYDRANLRGACRPCNSGAGATYGNRKRHTGTRRWAL